MLACQTSQIQCKQKKNQKAIFGHTYRFDALLLHIFHLVNTFVQTAAIPKKTSANFSVSEAQSSLGQPLRRTNRQLQLRAHCLRKCFCGVDCLRGLLQSAPIQPFAVAATAMRKGVLLRVGGRPCPIHATYRQPGYRVSSSSKHHV